MQFQHLLRGEDGLDPVQHLVQLGGLDEDLPFRLFPGVPDGQPHEEVERIILTASGGPFREWSRGAMQAVTPEQVVAAARKWLHLHTLTTAVVPSIATARPT